MMSRLSRDLQIEVKYRTECGQRSIQQDSIGWSRLDRYEERGFLAVLSDGMGGMKNGEVYSEIAVKEMLKHFKEENVNEDIVLRLVECYAAARKAALARCPVPEEPEGGATVVAVCIQNGKCAFLSVGDSRLYLWRGGALLQLNREQTLGVLLDENAAMGYIPKEYAKSDLRDTIENNICEPGLKKCDIPIRPFDLTDGDILLLMSDGVPHTLTDKQIVQALNEMKGTASDSIEAAVKKANNPKQDNYTILEISVHAQKKGKEEA